MVEEYLQTLSLGEARVTIMNLAWLQWDVAQQTLVQPEKKSARYAHVFEQPSRATMYCVHIQVPGISLIVDACTPTAFLGTEYSLPGAPVFPDMQAQLASVGVDERDITHVVITHRHFDHIIGLTVQQNEAFVPRFPLARYYLGRADWEDTHEPDALMDQTLAVLHQRGLLELVDGDLNLAPGLSILHMPGETPGHQVLRLVSGGRTLYCLGDLYHHSVEVEQPGWMAPWDDSATMLASRQRFAQTALAEDALLVATHIPGIGGLRATAEGVCWESRDL